VNEDLTVFWSRADVEDAAFTGDELRRLPGATRRLLESHSLLRQSENLRVIECDACGECHVEEVEILVEPAGSKPRAYISCPDVGRVPVDFQRLQQWSVDLEAVARTAGAALGLDGKVTSITTGRIWLLGTRQFDHHTRDVFLVRGVNWPDNSEVLVSASRLATSPCPLILCLNRFPSGADWQAGNRMIFSLSETSWLDGDRPGLVNRIEAVSREHAGPRSMDPLPPTPPAKRAALMEEIKTRYNYRVKDIYQGAEVDRSYLNKWKLGQTDDASEPSRKIENFLRRHRRVRRVQPQSA
jgi:hypothetical protein